MNDDFSDDFGDDFNGNGDFMDDSGGDFGPEDSLDDDSGIEDDLTGDDIHDDEFTMKDAVILGSAMGWAFDEGLEEGKRRKFEKEMNDKTDKKDDD